ncbi:hypothetical protein [Nocardia puris]|uniref:Cysteine dioxygenase type I n=1 Tax=Nocardia puris TaxID=208602 RepID=A0A366CVE2_9NOCA|nr:hypothetical protein [Nocardia puris]RBO78527.1 hypothetical protein DFR74_1407 [Nocardia puris]
MPALETVIEPLRSLDWNDVEAVESATRKSFEQLTAHTHLLRDALTSLPDNPSLTVLCEHYDILDKVVLHDDHSGIRLRLHIFGPGYHDRPHNHRWTYASHILRGEYRHRLYGEAELDTEIDVSSLRAVHVRQERVGTSYALHHSAIHAVVAEPGTVSLVLRGPAIKERFLVMDAKNGQSWWQYGATNESPEAAAAKRMSAQRLEVLIASLDEWQLI